MKARRTFLTIVLLVAITQVATPLAHSSRGGAHDLQQMTIENLELKASNIVLLLSEMATQKKIPIGLEVSPADDLTQTKTIRLQIKHGTLADALNSIVKQNPLYTWRIQDEVVNVFPVESNRDSFLRDVLETKLAKFSIQRGVSRLSVRQSLTAAPAIKTVLTQHNVFPDHQSFMSRDVAPLGREYDLDASNISVSALLNQIVRESQTKFWIVLRYGDKRRYFVLNL